MKVLEVLSPPPPLKYTLEYLDIVNVLSFVISTSLPLRVSDSVLSIPYRSNFYPVLLKYLLKHINSHRNPH